MPFDLLKAGSFLKRAAVVAVGVVVFFAPGAARATTYHVDSAGSDDTTSGTSKGTAFASIGKALAKCVDGDKIIVWASATPYLITACMDVTAGVAICGSTGRPEDVVLSSDGKEHRIFTISHADALITGVTMEKAFLNSHSQYAGLGPGGGATIKFGTSGGTVSNCVIRSGKIQNWNAGAAGISIPDSTTQNALVTHCVISNCIENGSCNGAHLC